MQYLLTAEEYEALVPRKKLDLANKAIESLRELLVGDRCIHSTKRVKGAFEYCSDCPLSDISWRREGDKTLPSHELSKMMCPLSRDYPQ